MKAKHIVIYILSAAGLALVVCGAGTSMEAAKSALVLCAQTVIPSLFPFFVISSFMVNTGFVSCAGKIAAPISRRLFKVSGSGAVVFVMGILCGYPTGAKMVSELYENKEISRNEAMRLLPFCNNSGPLFVIGAVGAGMLGSTRLGVTLYAVHVVSAVLTGIFFSFFSKQSDGHQTSTVMAIHLGRAFSDAVCRAVQTMLNVCGFIVFFSVLREFLTPFIFKLLGSGALGLTVSGMAEVTLGAQDICVSGQTLPFTMILLSGIIGFGGVCVLLQVCGVVSQAGLGIKTYAVGKIFQMLVSMVITACVVSSWKTQAAFASISSLPHRYLEVAPYMLVAFFFACAYAAARKKN